MPETEILNGVRWTPPAEHRTYTPPAEPEPFEPPRVTARAVTVDGSVVEQAHASFTHAKSAFEKFLKDIPQEHYSADGLTAQIKMFSDTDAAKAVDAAVTQVRDRAEKAARQVDKIRRDLSPNGDTVAELRATRYWNRTKDVLDSAKEGAFGAAQKLIASADREQLGVLLQELPDYLTARGHTSEWIDAALGQAVPEYAQAAKQLKTANQAVTIAESNANSLRRLFSQGFSGKAVIVDGRTYDPDKG
jgi:hypothetical protein